MRFWSARAHIDNMVPWGYNGPGKLLSPGDTVAIVTPFNKALFVCLWWYWYKETYYTAGHIKYSMYNYIEYIMLGNGNTNTLLVYIYYIIVLLLF